MIKAVIVLIFANHWLYQVESLPTYDNKNECIDMLHAHLKAIPEDLLNAGLGVHSAECVEIPFPRQNPRREL